MEVPSTAQLTKSLETNASKIQCPTCGKAFAPLINNTSNTLRRHSNCAGSGTVGIATVDPTHMTYTVQENNGRIRVREHQPNSKQERVLEGHLFATPRYCLIQTSPNEMDLRQINSMIEKEVGNEGGGGAAKVATDLPVDETEEGGSDDEDNEDIVNSLIGNLL